jgi:hypothetical protein
MGSALRFFGASMVAFSVIGAGTAGAAPGGGAVSMPTNCLVSTPGFPDATGVGRIVSTPSGAQKVNCHAQLPGSTTLPGKATQVASGPCTIVVTPSGRVNARC